MNAHQRRKDRRKRRYGFSYSGCTSGLWASWHGPPGIMTHQIPRAFAALQPYLQAVVRDPRFWDGAHDPTHTGEIEVAPMPDDEKKEFFARFGALTETQNDR